MSFSFSSSLAVYSIYSESGSAARWSTFGELALTISATSDAYVGGVPPRPRFLPCGSPMPAPDSGRELSVGFWVGLPRAPTSLLSGGDHIREAVGRAAVLLAGP